MRLNESIVISAPPKLVWDYLAEPSNYLHFMSGITRWEVTGEQRTGLGARYRMLIRVGSAEVGGLIEIVEWHEQRDMAWSSVLGVDQRGRWRLRELDDGRTRVELRFAYGVAGSGIPGWIAELVAAPQLGGHLRRSLRQLKRQVEHERLRAEAAPCAGCRGRLALLRLTRPELALVHRERLDVQPLGLVVELSRVWPLAAARRWPPRARRDVLGRVRERCLDSRSSRSFDGPRGDLLGARSSARASGSA